ncbi:DUF5053 domain-containing protein [uncultured Bacteroides sp.]|uniref:DUF5053 domain-containing protein n=1 Tax=uncultured Bacteroides sp. TaxID=162156 RepID=UPI002602E70E|nr:DUF5053 domain-containing protein [uncultured Bacteroides sp.]
MDNLNELLKELKTLVGGEGEENRRRFSEILKELETRKDEPQVQEALSAFVASGVDEMKQDIATLRQQIEEEDYKLIPISYIAKKYFGKSASWLYQRINGNKVGGRQYTLNEEQKATFNAALQDIADRIRSFSIA